MGSSSRDLSSRRLHYGVIVGLVVLGAAFRLPGLTLNSLWLDELYTVYTITGDFGTFWGRMVNDIHPPLGSFVFWLAGQCFGVTDGVMRGVAALFGILGAPLLYGLFSRFVGRRAALASALGWTVLPFSIYYAQEARSYTMAFCLACVLLWRGLCLSHVPSRRNALALGLATALAMYVHYSFAALILALYPALVLWMNAHVRLRVVRLTQAAVVATVAYLPWAFTMLSDAFGRTTWVQPPSPAKLRLVLMKMLSGESGLAMLFALGFVLFLVRVSSTRTVETAGETAKDTVRARGILLATSIVPLAVAFAKSLVPNSPAMVNPQLMMVLAPPLLLAWGVGVGALRRGAEGSKLAAVLVGTWWLVACGVLVRERVHTEPSKADNRAAVAHIVARMAKTDEVPVILYSDDKPAFLTHYLRPHGLEAAAALHRAQHLPRLEALLEQGRRSHQPTRIFLLEAHRTVDRAILDRLRQVSHDAHTTAFVRAKVYEFQVPAGGVKER